MSKMDLCSSDSDSSGSSFVAATPLSAPAVAASAAHVSDIPSGTFAYPEDQCVGGVKVSGSSSLGKRPVSRVLFDDGKKSEIKQGKQKLDSSLSLVPAVISDLPRLVVSQISSTKERFAFEGKILNIYGTYDTDKDWRYLRCDLADEKGFDIVTLVAGLNHYGGVLKKIEVGACIRVEGAVVIPRTVHDGGSIDYALQVDATTSITRIPTFDTTLFFVPELSIKDVFIKASKNPTIKSTIAFIIVQVDSARKNESSMHEQLTIADGPLPINRATLTFVAKRKSLYYQLVDEFHRGHVVPYLARNIGVWSQKSNTLSILDMTLVFPLQIERLKKELAQAFDVQAQEQGYGKELHGILTIKNINGTLLVKKCRACKGKNLNVLGETGFCYSCGANVNLDEELRLIGEIQQPGKVTSVTITGEACDKVLQFEEPLLVSYKKSVILTRVALSEAHVEGYFIIDTQGQVIGFRKPTIPIG